MTSVCGLAQVSGKKSFQFINLPGNAHVAALGGVNVSTFDRDINMVWQNPALLRDTMTGRAAIGYIPFFASVRGGSLSYAHKFNRLGTVAMGLHYINYGSMTERDETGNELGEFRPQDIALTIAKAHTIGVFTLGGTLKIANSTLASGYSSFALMVDAGGIYRHPTRDFTIGMVIKNVGFAVKRYNSDASTRMPFDVQLGASYKLEHLPVRFSVTAHHLYKLDIVYLDTSMNKKVDLDGNETVQEKSLGDKIMRHFVFSTEILLSKSLHFRIGYDYMRRRELRLVERAGGTGFSWGFMVKAKAFQLDFSRATYHLAGGKNWVTLYVDINRLLGK